ncbi:MAG: protein translocase subunit secG [Magnetococcales bacterium]|nr:protein translocase subunit secG [Magnetococcales bacterium]
MALIVTVVHILVSLALIFVVLLQKGSGADMGAAFGGSSQSVFGSRGSGSFLGKLTATLATIFMVTSLSLAFFTTQRGAGVSVMGVPAAGSQKAGAGETPPATGAEQDLVPPKTQKDAKPADSVRQNEDVGSKPVPTMDGAAPKPGDSSKPVGKPGADAGRTLVVPKTDAKPENVGPAPVVPKTDAKPENVGPAPVVPKTDAKPETLVVPKTDAKPETPVVPKTDAKPENVGPAPVVPKTDAKSACPSNASSAPSN